jgi:hypothetical protein
MIYVVISKASPFGYCFFPSNIRADAKNSGLRKIEIDYGRNLAKTRQGD